MDNTSGKDWKSIALARQTELKNAIPESHRISPSIYITLQDPRHLINVPETCGVLTQREIEITTTPSVVKLLEDIKNRVYTAVEVTTAFCKRASIAHQLTNCIAEFLYDSALARAQELDNHLNATGKTVGPLHGLPISVKEHIYLAGTKSSCAFIALADHTGQKDAHLLEIFRNAGAVFHVKTTNPLSLLGLETHSNLFGRTVSPFNTDLSPGGSSGGEGALISLRGSIFGIGTDIGGSLRTPSVFSNIYSLKSSMARVPLAGVQIGLHPGMDSIHGVIGPMTPHIEGIGLFFEVALGGRPWLTEPYLVNKLWDKSTISENAKKPLKIGLMLSDGVVYPHPAIVRSLKETAKALTDAGHEVIPWIPLDHKGITELITSLFFQDNGNGTKGLLKASGEEPTALILLAMERYSGRHRTLEESWDLGTQRNEYRVAYNKLWNETKVDAILCPTAPTASALHDTSRYWGYTSVWNLLDYSVAVFPAGRVSDIDGEAPFPEGVDLNAQHPRNSPEELNQTNTKLWFDKDQEGKVLGPIRYKYAPIGLQLVGRRLEEEKVLGMLEAVVDARKRAGLKEY